MSLSALLLQQQMSATQKRLQDKYEAEDRRREKSGFWSGMGNFGGGLLGLAGAGLAGLTGPVGIGLAAGLGSLAGGRLGQQWSGGGTGQETRLGKNISTLTGGEKEFTEDVKDRYRKNVQNFQSDQNQRILNKAIGTGIKAAGFAYTSPDAFQDGISKIRNRFGFGGGQSIAVPDATKAVSTMQNYNPMSSNVSRITPTPQASFVPNSYYQQSIASRPPIATMPAAASSTNVAVDPSLANALPNPVPNNVPSISVDTLFDNMFNTGAPQGEGVMQYNLYQNQLDPFGLMNFNTTPANNLLNKTSMVTPQMRPIY